MVAITIRLTDELAAKVRAKVGARGMNALVAGLLEGWVGGAGEPPAARLPDSDPALVAYGEGVGQSLAEKQATTRAILAKFEAKKPVAPAEPAANPEFVEPAMGCVVCGDSAARQVRRMGKVEYLCRNCWPDAG